MTEHMIQLYAAMGLAPRLQDMVDDNEAFLDYEEYGDVLEEAALYDAMVEHERILNEYNKEIGF